LFSELSASHILISAETLACRRFGEQENSQALAVPSLLFVVLAKRWVPALDEIAHDRTISHTGNFVKIRMNFQHAAAPSQECNAICKTSH
jgi:hypothetical protein